jgi:hypothetical protein
MRLRPERDHTDRNSTSLRLSIRPIVEAGREPRTSGVRILRAPRLDEIEGGREDE